MNSNKAQITYRHIKISSSTKDKITITISIKNNKKIKYFLKPQKIN